MPASRTVVAPQRPKQPSAAVTAQMRTLPAALSCADLQASWKALDTLPAQTRGEVMAAIPVLEAALAPASIQAAAVALEPLTRLVDRYGLVPLPAEPDAREAELGRIALGYREDLAELPGDLLVMAVQRVVATHRYRNLPLPAEFRKAVAENLAHRRGALSRLQSMLKLARFAEPALPREDRVTPAQLSELRRAIASATLHRPLGGASASDGVPESAQTESLERAREADSLPDYAFGAAAALPVSEPV